MGEMLIQGSAQAPAAARSASAADAEAAQLDARLELAATKAALRAMEAQAGPPAAEAPELAELAPSGRIVVERDGKTVILDNPTAEQLSSLGMGVPSPQPPLEGWQVIGLTGIVMGSIVLLTAITLWYRRTMRAPASATGTAQSEARMARIENALESIAVEVERISEGQRYASRMLAEGAAVPVVVADQGEALLQNRGEGSS